MVFRVLMFIAILFGVWYYKNSTGKSMGRVLIH